MLQLGSVSNPIFLVEDALDCVANSVQSVGKDPKNAGKNVELITR